MRRVAGIKGVVAVCAVAIAGALSPIANAAERRGDGFGTDVAIVGGELKITQSSANFGGLSAVVDYDAVGNQWSVTGINPHPGAGCGAGGSGTVICAFDDEDVRVAFGSQGGQVTLEPADIALDFKSTVVLGPDTDVITTGSGADMVTSPVTQTSITGDSVETKGGADDITLANGADTVDPGLGNDTVKAGGGDDTLIASNNSTPGPDGNDTWNGGDGVDTLTYSSRTADVTATIGGSGGEAGENDTIGASVENLTGGTGNDTLTGDEDANTLRGGNDGGDTFFGGTGKGPDGADKIFAGSGVSTNIDTMSYANRKDGVTSDIGGGANDADGDDISADIDTLIGGSGPDVLKGDDDANTIVGGPGVDIIQAKGGADVVDARDDGEDSIDCGTETDVAKLDSITGEVKVLNCETIEQAADTEITKAPMKHITTSKTKVKFASPGMSDALFECSLDGEAFASCESPLELKHLKKGKHVFEVRALNAQGDPDVSPARAKFKRVDD